MSYIRTKDGRILDFDKLNEVSKLSIDMAEEPIREAKTIEELCDGFVYCKRGFYEIYRQLDFAHYDKEYIKNGGTIKGAIWTSKGLIYVAKMNENGELELI